MSIEILYKPDVLILCSGEALSDPRVIRQEQALKKDFSIQVLDPTYVEDKKGTLNRSGLGWRFRQLQLILKGVIASEEESYRVFPESERLWTLIFDMRPKVIICNDLELLGCALAHKKAFGSRVVFDAHEYYLSLIHI